MLTLISEHCLPGIRNFSSSNVMSKKIEEFVVIGGGLMGAGIAQVKLIYNYLKEWHNLLLSDGGSILP